LIGQMLSHYRITGAIGAGGMGEVYRATDTKLGREVAIKVLPAEVAGDADRLARFEREARAVAALSHPNILALFDFGTHEGTAYAVTELLEGATLRERLAGGPLPVRKTTEYAAQIARGLAAAHDKGIVHRDLKPENLFVTADGHVKILDFGLARQEAPLLDASDTRSPTLARPTDAGTVLGTVGYMSPEQVRGQVVDARSDIFSLGCVVHEMLAGQRAFSRETGAETMTAILREEAGALPDACPPALARVVERCLEKAPAERFQSARDLAFALESATVTSASGRHATTSAEAPPRARRSALRALGVLAVAALSAAGGALLTRRSPPELPTFRQLTYQRGMVHSARFAPDQQAIVYGGAFEGAPVALFSTRPDAIDSRSLGLPSADVAGISRKGEMAVLLGRRNVGSWLRVGTLARVSLDGGSPQPILENVFDADIAADGASFAAVRQTGSGHQLEYPIGTVLFRNRGWIALPRLARDGRRVAFVDHPFFGDDRGYVAVVGQDGKAERISPVLDFLQGLAWSPTGDAVWASAGDRSGGSAVWELAPGRTPKRVLSFPCVTRLQDVAADGRLLVTTDESRAEIEGRLAGDERARPYSGWTDDGVGGIAPDGSFFAGELSSIETPDREYIVYVRRSGGSAPARLGSGTPGGVTPDGKWVIAALHAGDRRQLTLFPTGPGQPRRLSLGSVEPQVGGVNHVTSSADGRRLGFLGNAPGEGARAYVVDSAGGAAPRAVTPEGMTSVTLSPDGERVAALDAEGELRIHPVGGGAPAAVAGARKGEVPIAWDSSGRALFVWDRSLPGELVRVDLATGRREARLRIAPLDPAGVIYGQLVTTPDARYFLIRFRRMLSTLVLVEGLR
jgi:hypothetical protein